MTTSTHFPTLLTSFFTQRLTQQQHVSPHTISSYRDTFRLLLQFSKTRLGKEPSNLTWEDIDAPLICDFLDNLQKSRGISARSRNLRLTAIRSFFRFAAFELPAQSEQIQRILAIPSKCYTHRQINFLNRAEIDALLAAPDGITWSGCRDRAWLLLATQTGLRLSELTGLTRQDVHLDAGAYVHVIGKGRKERCTPLTKQTTAIMRAWLAMLPPGDGQVVFPNRNGSRLSNDGVEYLLKKHVETASSKCPSLKSKQVSPHVLRHYLPFLTMSSNVKDSVGMFGIYYSRRLKTYVSTRHSFRLETVEKI